ncbi:hypothetical protein DC3_00050 [Deinococcus cellulosilyticus NBRC 106333 = KACC 11606]|uniref:XdhC Rossmann domain-containing protein n=1 Tax=Deinococcus cellulosilyticus (strain DSM 18568 / NBRC 106333 / KACC 11606 / 5516J-15) TaxID=1223518 RepID=A0A511MUU7_DEIC1|nr:hypothetical protein DC3_00050 [Deinococcus cellulosilyticus NBRC 106333 = KACC 11606]
MDEPCTFFIESMEQLPESWRMAVEHLKHREGCIVATELDDHPRHYLLSEEDAPVRPDRRGTLLSGVFLQRLEPALRMVVSGSQDTASSLLSLARAIHLEVTSVGSTLPELDAWTALVVFPEPEHEVLQVLLKALQGEVGYIGVVCSLWHARHLKERLLQAGAPRMERVFAPAGLHLGTVSSQGMALEILAEILAVFHQQEPHSLDLKSADWMGPFR